MRAAGNNPRAAGNNPRAAGNNPRAAGRLISNRIFKGILLSYVSMITLFLAAYLVMAVGESVTVHRERVAQEYRLKAWEFGNAMDLQIVDAKNAVSGVNKSESVRELYTSAIMRRGVPDPYLVYQITREMTAIKTSTKNLRLYNILLFFDNYDKVYSSSKISVLDANFTKARGPAPDLRLTTVRDLLALPDAAGIAFLKEHIIYSDEYTFSGSPKGTVLVMFDRSGTLKAIRDILGDKVGFTVTYRGSVSFANGRADGLLFSQESAVDPNLTYEILVDPSVNAFTITGAGWIMIGMGIGFCTLLAALAWAFACRYYRPYSSIAELLSPETGKPFEDIDHFVGNIQGLVGERNGFREKMTVIAPYAKQGMIHTMINGDKEFARLSVVDGRENLALKKGYFSLAVLDLAYTGNAVPGDGQPRRILNIIEGAAKSFSREERTVGFYYEDMSRLYLIVNSDDDGGLDDLFLELHRELARQLAVENCVVTMGVSGVKNGLEQIREAYDNARKALDGMITGGRDSVFFYDQKIGDGKTLYWFPNDAGFRIAKALRERNLAEILAILEEIYERNTMTYDLDAGSTRLLIDELHIATIKAIRERNTAGGTRVSVEKAKSVTTLEESFDYYRSVFRALLEESGTDDRSAGKSDAREEEIVSFVSAHFTDPTMSLQLLSGRFGVSAKSILAAFRKREGITYHQFIQDRRIALASDLMKSGEHTLESVCERCGYTSLLTFRRNFRSVTGVNPSDFRARG